jgi:hypothetical protein
MSLADAFTRARTAMMKFSEKLKEIIPAMLVITACIQCTGERLAGGSGSDVGNGRIEGRLITKDGTPASEAIVTLVPGNYDPITMSRSDVMTATTNEAGEFDFSSVKNDQYNIIANQPSSGLRDIIRDVVIGDKDIMLSADTLRVPGSIRIYLTDTIDPANGYVFILGTTISAFVNKQGYVQMDSVPSGTIHSVFYGITNNASSLRSITDSVTVEPGATTVVMYSSWKFSKKLYLNTTQSGAQVPGNIVNFPVLVRLTQANFNFSEAKIDGSDLRFAKKNGTPISYEIERWDVSSQAGEVWVKVDTVFGNDSTHYINMYWGNTNANSTSNSPAVFDTANGFGGVWHLNEQTGNVSDATINANPGKDEGTSSSSGLIGNARYFQNSRISMGAASVLCSYSDSITISGWLKSIQKPSSTISVIRHVGHITAMQFDQAREFTSFWTVQSANYTDITIPTATVSFIDGTWHHITARFKTGTGCSVFKDGVLMGQNTADTATLHTTAGAFYLGGTETGNEYFDGSLDEIRIERAFRSADWEKLCYMNQRTDDKLIKSK